MRRHPKASPARATAVADRRTSAAVAALACALLAGLLCAASASAVVKNVWISQFDGHETPQGSIEGEGIAVDGAGNVYVSASPAKAVDKFDAAGKYVSQFKGGETPQGEFVASGLAATSAGDVYLVDALTERVDKFDPTGHFLFQVTGATTPQGTLGAQGVAVDSSGNLYVASSNGVVDKFDSSGAYLSQFNGSETPGGSLAFPFDLAVDSSGNVYVDDLGFGVIDKFDATGKYVSQFDGSGTPAGSFFPSAVAVAPSGDVYISDLAGAVVDRFSSTGTYLSQFSAAETPQEAWSGLLAFKGLATDSAGDVYVQQSGGRVDEFTGAVLVPGALTEAATGIDTEGHVTLHGTVNPDGVAVTACSFEYGTTTAYGKTAPCAETPGEIGSGSSDVPVHADLSGVAPGNYHFRLTAANANGTNRGGDLSFVTTGKPAVLSTTAIPGVAEATLKGSLNPSNAETTYHFEYGTTTAYGSSTVPAKLPKGATPVTIKAHVVGLAPATTYHVRIVAENEVGVTLGPDETFTTSSPPGADSCPNAAIRQAQGSAFLPECRAYELVSPDESGKSVNPVGTQVRADGNAFLFTDAAAVESPATQGSPRENRVLTMRGADGWTAQPIDPVSQGDLTYDFYGTLAISQDFSHSLITSDMALAPGGVEGAGNLYLRSLASGQLTFVATSTEGLQRFSQWSGISELDKFLGGTSDFSRIVFASKYPLLLEATPGVVSLYEWSSAEGLKLFSVMPDGSPAVGNAQRGHERGSEIRLASANLSTVAFGIEGAGVYARLDGETTVPVSVSQVPAEPTTPHPGEAFWVSPDGRYADFYTADPAPLTTTAPSRAGNLYRYDLETGALQYLGGPINVASGIESTIIAVSDDGSRVYFDDPSRNLSLAEAGTVTPIGKFDLNANDARTVSPSGRFLEFEIEKEPEMRLYDAVEHELICISCSPDGLPSLGHAHLPETPHTIGSNLTPRTVTDEGVALFDTPTGLVPADVNGKRDVYAFHDGSLQLLSPGNGDYDARLLDLSPGLKDVYFYTEQRLVAGVRGGGYNVYDARVGGGFESAAEAAPCAGEGCQVASPPAALRAPGIASGAGNVKSGKRRCRAGGKAKGRSQRRCVKKHGTKNRKAPNRRAGSTRRAGR